MEEGRPFNQLVVRLILRNALNWYQIPVKKQELIDNGFYQHNNQERDYCFQQGWLIEGIVNNDGVVDQYVTLSDSGLQLLKQAYPEELSELNSLQRMKPMGNFNINHWYVLIKDIKYDIVTKQVTMVFVKSIDDSTGQQTFTLDPKSAMHFRSSGACKTYVDQYGFDVQRYSSIEERTGY